MDSWVCNYDSDATIDNGECEYLNDPIVSMTDYVWVLEYENGCYGEPTEISGSFILTFFNNNTWIKSKWCDWSMVSVWKYTCTFL